LGVWGKGEGGKSALRTLMIREWKSGPTHHKKLGPLKPKWAGHTVCQRTVLAFLGGWCGCRGCGCADLTSDNHLHWRYKLHNLGIGATSYFSCYRDPSPTSSETSRRKVDGGPGLGQQEARQGPQPQIPTERETEAGCLASHFYQLKLTGQYLQWTTRRPDTKCWWCQSSIQTRERLFKNCPQWRSLQKTL